MYRTQDSSKPSAIRYKTRRVWQSIREEFWYGEASPRIVALQDYESEGDAEEHARQEANKALIEEDARKVAAGKKHARKRARRYGDDDD